VEMRTVAEKDGVALWLCSSGSVFPDLRMAAHGRTDSFFLTS
jgi:hypothetical protein